jgi:hypothetical protein
MANIQPTYSASTSVTITLASLASSGTLVAGRESTAIDNTSTRYGDFLLGGKITTGTSPTTQKMIEILIVPLVEDATYPDVFDGTDSDETFTTIDIKNASAQLLKAISTDATSDRTYWFAGVSIASFFGGILPKKFTLFVTHSTGVNLNSTGGNHALYLQPVMFTSA